MPGRVLNFSEFFGKYSSDNGEKDAASFDDFAKAASNFEAGFDENSYDKTQLGPNRPVSGGEGAVPVPGDAGAPKFRSAKPEGMEAPEETEEEEIETPETEEEEAESPEAEEAEEESEESEENDEEEEEESEEDEEETPEPEKGANPRIKKTNESDEYPEFNDSYDEESEEKLELGQNPRFASAFDEFSNTLNIETAPTEPAWDENSWEEESDEEGSDFVICQSCGNTSPIQDISPEEHEWYKGDSGMQCGCK